MTLTLTLLALSFISAFTVLLVNILNAPEGYEDENGFQLTSVGNHAEPVLARVEVTIHRAAA